MNKNEVELELIHKLYPVGTRVVLDFMDDEHAPPIGTHGTVTAIDSIGTIHVAWDNRNGLGLIYGKDKFHKEE